MCQIPGGDCIFRKPFIYLNFAAGSNQSDNVTYNSYHQKRISG